MDILNGHLVLFVDKMDSTQICSINLPIDVDCKVFNLLVLFTNITKSRFFLLFTLKYLRPMLLYHGGYIEI